MRVVGIDPGLRGAACVIETGPRRISLIDSIDLPTFSPSGTDAQMRIHPSIIGWIAKHKPDAAVIELVTAMPSIPDKAGVRRDMGQASLAKFMRATGAIEMAVMGCLPPKTIPIWVMGGVWKRHYGIVADKAVSRELANQFFGGVFPLVKHGNRAEAALIARYHVEKLGLFGRVG